MDILLTFHHVHARHAYMQFYHTQLSACTSDNHSLNGVAIYRHFSTQVNVHTSYFRSIWCILVSHPPPVCFFGTRFAGIIVYFTISRSVCVDATDLICYSRTAQMSHSLKYRSAYRQTLLLLQGVWPRESRSRTFFAVGE